MVIAAPAAHAQKVPDWQMAAGGKMAFDVASVRENPFPKYNSSIPMDADNVWASTGGLFNVDGNLAGLISFAYKLPQQNNMLQHLPDWAKTKSFDVQARAASTSPTKDQMRLMVQSLLADRFKLAIHFEPKVTPVQIVTLAKPGKMGPRLRLHADGPRCDVVKPRSPGAPGTFDMFPCQVYLAINNADGTILAGARNTTVELMAAFFTNVGHMRPIVDRTGINAAIDFSIAYTPERRSTAQTAGAENEAQSPGTTFEEAVKEQLGLKLKPATAPLEVPVVDHVEMPSEN